MEFEDFIRIFFTVISLLWVIPFFLGETAPVGDTLIEVVDIVKNLFPFLIGIGIIVMILSWAMEQTSSDPLETIITTDLKFWEWSLIKYLAFTVGIIVITTIINKPFGFVVSLVLLVIAIFLRIPYEYKIAKERA